MRSYATKSYFEELLKGYAESGCKFFQIISLPDCCPICKARANRKMFIATATKEDIPPFHDKCRCYIAPIDLSEDSKLFKTLNKKCESGAYPMVKCPHCSEWIEGNARKCKHCGTEV